MFSIKMENALFFIFVTSSAFCFAYSKDFIGRSCLELKQMKINKNGVYPIAPCASHPRKTINVYCDMETDDGGWTIIQRRDNFTEQTNFTRSWEDYAKGFGSVRKDFWLGNDVIHCLTSQLPTTVRFDLKDFEGHTVWAKYSNFSVDNDVNLYQLQVNGYTGNATDSFANVRHNGMKFSTIDSDNDISSGSCSQLYKGGWWYGSCHSVNLNGLYLEGHHSSYADGVNWYHWKGYHYSLKKTEMKIRGSGILPPWRETIRNCDELKENNVLRSGIYSITPCESDPERTAEVYCDMETDDGGWTIIQRRDNFTEQTNFTRSWEDYANGFGSVRKDFWLGNALIHCLTSQVSTTVRFDLEDFEGQTAWAKYSTFSVDDRENLYKLQVSGYTGNASNSFESGHHNGMNFSTIDSDNDIYSSSCSKRYKGGWWYGRCHSVNLNGLYLEGNHSSYADGVNWKGWKGYHYSLKKTEIKIRGNGILPTWTTEIPYKTTTHPSLGDSCTTSGQTYRHGESWNHHCRDLMCIDGHVKSSLNNSCCQSDSSDYISGSTWFHHCKHFKCVNGFAKYIGKDLKCGDCLDKKCSKLGGFCTTSKNSCDGKIKGWACKGKKCVCCIPRCSK